MASRNTSESAGSGLAIDDLDVIVDADGHVMEDVDDFLPYMDDRYDGIKRRIGKAPHPPSSVYTHTMVTPGTYTYDSGQALGIDADTVYTGTDGRSHEAKLSEMESFGIDYSIITPTLNLGITTVNDPEFTEAIAKAYNEWIAAEFLDRHEGLRTGILVPPQLPEVGAEEIDRWASEDGMVAVVLTAANLIPPAGDRLYDPIYEAAQANDLPILYHGATAPAGVHFPRLWSDLHTNAEAVSLSHPFQIMSSFATTMLRGIPERFPDLKHVFQEAGVGWVPYMTWRLDDQYLAKADEIPHLQKLPSEYIHEDDLFYFTTQPVGHTARNPRHLAMAIELAGPDSMIYSADLPHPAFDPPEELFNRIRGHFDEETVRKIMGENAADLFNLNW